MLRRIRNVALILLPPLLPGLGLGTSSASRADAITWSGASTSVQVFGQTDSHTGATAASSAQGTTTIPYWPDSYTVKDGELPTNSANGSATSQVSGTAANLLSASASYFEGATLGRPAAVAGPVQATASWTGDRLLLQSSGSNGLPDSVRVNFSLTFLAPGAGDIVSGIPRGTLATITASFNNRDGALSVGRLFPTSASGTPFDSIEAKPYIPPGWEGPWASREVAYKATFHLDLPLSASGISDPFSLGLKVDAATDFGMHGYAALSGLDGVTLSMTSLSLADGNTPESEGYSVAFASGLVSPDPVPEPTTIAVLAAGFGAIVLRRARTKN